MSGGMAGHESTRMGKDEWLTPPEIVEALGPFDTDPCAPVNPPWHTAFLEWTVEDNGLLQPWPGFVWMNPPYGRHTGTWLKKLADHGNGIALIFARTETRMFFDHIWDRADALLFLKGRIRFYHVDGTPGDFCGGAPSVLVAYGQEGVERLRRCAGLGKVVILSLLCMTLLSGCLGTIPVAPDHRIQGTWAPGVEAYQVNRFTVIEQEGETQVCTWISSYFVCY